MGVLKLVGEGIEKPEIISKLLDTTYFKERPTYPLASPNNLILFDCKYKDVNFYIPEGANQFFLEQFIFNLYNEQVLRLKLISSIAQNYKNNILENNTIKIKKVFKKKLKKRRTIEESYKNHVYGKKNLMVKPSEKNKLKKKKKMKKKIQKMSNK